MDTTFWPASWKEFFARDEVPRDCRSCGDPNVVRNGKAERSAIVRQGEKTVAIAGIVLQRVRCSDCSHPELDRPSRHTERTTLAWGVLHGIDQLLIIVAHYEQAIVAAPRRAKVRTAANDEKWEQLALPFPNWPTAHERARGAEGEGAR